MEAEQIRSIDVINGTINAIPGVQDPGDKALNVVFKMHSHFDDVKTRAEGRPIFEMREYIMITAPGDTTSNVFRPAYEFDHRRFPEQYLRYKVGQEQAVGTPLTEVSWLSRAQCDELVYFRIQTVEQLAVVSDANCQRFMGLAAMKERAQRYLEQVKQDAPINHLNAELKTRDETIATMQAQMKQMQEYIEGLKHREDVAEANARGSRPPDPPRQSRAEERAEAEED